MHCGPTNGDGEGAGSHAVKPWLIHAKAPHALHRPVLSRQSRPSVLLFCMGSATGACCRAEPPNYRGYAPPPAPRPPYKRRGRWGPRGVRGSTGFQGRGLNRLRPEGAGQAPLVRGATKGGGHGGVKGKVTLSLGPSASSRLRKGALGPSKPCALPSTSRSTHNCCTPCVTFRRVAVSLRGPGQSPVLPFAMRQVWVGQWQCVKYMRIDRAPLRHGSAVACGHTSIAGEPEHGLTGPA